MSKKGPERRLISGKGKNMDGIAGQGSYDWDEKEGQEIILKHVVSRVGPNDKVVDLGSGYGRASIPLAMRGAKVIAVDQDSERLKEGDEIRKKAGARRSTNIQADIRGVVRKTIKGGVRAVIASDALNHLPKKDADQVIDNLPKLLNTRKGGVVYVNAPATDSPLFQYPEYHGGERVGPKR